MQIRAVRAVTRIRHRSENAPPPFSNKDPLDRLLDGAAFKAVLRATLSRADAATVLSIRLDRLNTIDESSGQAIGDELQQKAAERLLSVIGGMALAAWLGGDAFSVLQMCGGGDDGDGRLAARIVDKLGGIFLLNAHVVSTAVCVGVARAPEHARTADQLMACADLAMRKSTQVGRSGFGFFASEMETPHRSASTSAQLCLAD